MIRNLDGVLIDDIYDAFIDAFSEYETKMNLTIDQFKKMLVTRSYNSKYSRGYFDKNVLVGFILIGYREQRGEKIIYDTATGIRQDYQKKGIGNILLEELMNEIRVERIDKFLLEVLENNIPAQELYKKHGFQVTRKLSCFEYDLTSIAGTDGYSAVINNVIENNLEEYCSFYPSWQNSNESFTNCKDDYTKIDFFNKDSRIGYVIININNGSILQFGLGNEYRKKIVIDNILWKLKKDYTVNKIKMLNIEDESEMDILLNKYGMSNFINQFEMEYKSNRT